MDPLHKKKCVACDGNTIPFDVSEIHKYLKKIDGWDVKNNNENYYLEKEFKFKNFIDSQAFVNKNRRYSRNRRTSPRFTFWLGICKS